MMRLWLKYGLSFFGYILLQGLIINNIELGGYIVPFLYVIFILSLPFETPSWLVLIVGFMLGVAIDSFTNTLGMHTSATVFLAFSRHYVLQLVAPREGYGYNTTPSVKDMGLKWYLFYASILVGLHHVFLFYVESFQFAQFFQTFGRAFLSAFFTLVLVLMVQLLHYKSDKKK